MGLLKAHPNKVLTFKIQHTSIWASMKLFEDTEKASIRHWYKFQIYLKHLKSSIGKLKKLLGPLQMCPFVSPDVLSDGCFSFRQRQYFGATMYYEDLRTQIPFSFCCKVFLHLFSPGSKSLLTLMEHWSLLPWKLGTNVLEQQQEKAASGWGC